MKCYHAALSDREVGCRVADAVRSIARNRLRELMTSDGDGLASRDRLRRGLARRGVMSLSDMPHIQAVICESHVTAPRPSKTCGCLFARMYKLRSCCISRLVKDHQFGVITASRAWRVPWFTLAAAGDGRSIR